MRRFSAPILLVLPIMLLGCASAASVAPVAEHDLPRWEPMPDLREKAERHETDTLALVDEVGLLLYHAQVPWENVPWDPERAGKPVRDRYLRSHQLDDAPAWQGYLMAALAFKAAALARDAPDPSEPELARALAEIDTNLERLAGAFHHFYAVSGEPGHLANTVMPPGYQGDLLPFMARGDEHKPWVRSDVDGSWWRDGINKGHLNLAGFGCAVPLALDRAGAIDLSPRTRERLVTALVPMVRRLVDDGYVIRNRVGRKTQHGDLRPNTLLVPNCFHRMIVLHLLASAAPYDAELHERYETIGDAWDDGIVSSAKTSAWWVRQRGHWNDTANLSVNDTQHFALACCSLLLQESRPERREPVIAGLEAWWTFMQHELNAPYSIVVASFAAPDPDAEEAIMAPILDELRDFPPVKYVVDPEHEIRIPTPGVVQPIANRPMDSNYWKSNPFVRTGEPEPKLKGYRLAGTDYLLAYWMGRALEVIEPTASGAPRSSSN